jgi:hypothetical protein
MSEEKAVTLGDLEDTVSLITGLFNPFRERLAKTMTPEKFAQLEAEPPNECPNCGTVIAESDKFCDDECKDAWRGIDKMQIERDRIAGQREDAEEHRRELARENADRLCDEVIELMVREPTIEPDEDRLTDEARERRIT